MSSVDDSEALKLLEQSPRLLGWTIDQWSLIAGQAPGKYRPTREDAFRLRLDWLNSMQVVDLSKKDDQFAAMLFYNIAEEQYRQGVTLDTDRVKGCG